MPLGTGTKLGTYEILSPLGAGGMGEVYRARDTKLNREVALKVLPEAFAADPQRMARFEREAQVLASLNHSNIAAIYGLEESGQTRALVMELVEGQTLAERIGTSAQPASGARSGSVGAIHELPLQENLQIAKQVAEALEYAHERGVVHRDLKPANIKINPEGAVKVLDFGLAKAMGPDEISRDASNSPTLSLAATQAGFILGTAAYMAPEQAKAKPVDRRCDIWSFGVVLFEMFSGKKAFDGETVSDVLAAVIMKDPDWTALPETTPPSIQRLIRRCLNKDPKQRLQAIGEARITIEEALSGTGVPPVTDHGPEAHATTSARPAPLRILPWALAGMLAIVAAVFAVGYFERAPLPAMHFSAVTNFAGVQAQPAISPDGRSVAFVANRDGHFNVYVTLARGGSLLQITHDANLESRPSWSPDGTTLAYARLNQQGLWDIWEIPALGGTPRRVILNAADPTWSPDGHSLAYMNLSQDGYGGIWISGISGENAHQAAPPWAVKGWVLGHDTQPRFSPNGREIAFIASDADGGPAGRLAVADLDSGKMRFLARGHAVALSPAWSPDGRFIYFGSSRGGTINIWKIAAAGGKPEQITAGEGDDVDVDVSTNGKEIVFGTMRQKIGIAQLDLQAKPGEPNIKVLTTDPARNQIAPVYSPDGKHLAYFTNLKGVEKEAIWVSDADGTDATALVQDSHINIFPAWTPDSKDLIYTSLGAEVRASWASDDRRVGIAGGAPKSLFSTDIWSILDVGHDGRVLFLDAKGKAAAFNPRTGKTQALGTLSGALPWNRLLWSPDEHAVAYMVTPGQTDNSMAGLWVTDFQNPPRQIFRGWVVWIARGPGNEIYLLEGKPDLNAVLWKVNWNGQGLTRTPWTVPLLYDDSYRHMRNDNFFDVSPDGRYLAFTTNQVLEENISMIQNAR